MHTVLNNRISSQVIVSACILLLCRNTEYYVMQAHTGHIHIKNIYRGCVCLQKHIVCNLNPVIKYQKDCFDACRENTTVVSLVRGNPVGTLSYTNNHVNINRLSHKHTCAGVHTLRINTRNIRRLAKNF